MTQLRSALSVAAAPALAETFPVKMASYQKGYFKGFTSVALPSYNFTLITANQATAVGGGAASRLNAVLVGIDQAEMRKMADEAHADLLVVGAYRYSEVLEWAMRSTTRQILKAADLPLLLMH